MKCSFRILLLLSILLLSVQSVKSSQNPTESARNIQNGQINVQSNTDWVIGGWGFASPFNSRNFGEGRYNWGSSNFGSGNFGDNNIGNGNYGTGNLGDENLGNYNVGHGNCGQNNMGRENNGQWNVGEGNSGDYNLGRGNVGTGNTGISNVGVTNVGGLNNGKNNLGMSNSGQSNFGIENIGTENVGWKNNGNWNVGNENDGNGNVGVKNMNGNFNLGYLNLGSNNTGAWNNGKGNVGYLSGIKSSTISGGPGDINWKSITNLQLDSNPADGATGWANLNTTNVGIGQAGYNNLGYANIGGFNIGYQLDGNQNTGGNLTGDNLIGFDQNPGPGSNIEGVSIQGTLGISLLNSSVYGYLQDSLVAPFPQVYDESLSAVLQTTLTPFNPDTCETFSPVQLSNTFSISVKCRGSVKITDLYCSGDSFIVYKDGKLWFTTPVVSIETDPKCVKSQIDPGEAFYDPEFSHAQAWLPTSGSFKITVVPAATRWGGGAVAIKVDDFCDNTSIGQYIRY